MKLQSVCGECKHFMQFENSRRGRCAKRQFLYKQGCGAGRSSIMQNREFIPSYGRKACVTDFEPVAPKKKTRFETLDLSDVDKMVEFLATGLFCPHRSCPRDIKDCDRCVKDYLQEEVE